MTDLVTNCIKYFVLPLPNKKNTCKSITLLKRATRRVCLCQCHVSQANPTQDSFSVMIIFVFVTLYKLHISFILPHSHDNDKTIALIAKKKKYNIQLFPKL